MVGESNVMVVVSSSRSMMYTDIIVCCDWKMRSIIHVNYHSILYHGILYAILLYMTNSVVT